MELSTYEKIVADNTPRPESQNVCWAEDSKLCILFVEFRKMDIIKYNLWNLANVYGGTDTSLTIVHSGENRDDIMEITRDWKNVRYMELYEKNIDVNEYSRLFCSYGFWNSFSNHEFVLVNQWDSYLFKKIPEKFFEYDYVGGPCGHYYVRWRGHMMNICCSSCRCDRCKFGEHPYKDSNFETFPEKYILLNGGFSLRKVSSMKSLCNRKTWNGEPEDVYFTISDLSRPTREEAKEFAIQSLPYGEPAGCHQIWVEHDEDYIRSLFE